MAINTTLFGALEDLDEDVAGDEEVEESGVSEDITDAEDEVEGTEEVIDGASTDLEALEEIKDVLEDAAEEGEGIDETAAKVVEVAVESIYARLGIPASNIMGSTESFSNVRSRKTATKMAAEGIKDTIVRGWEAVRKFFIDLWKKIKELYARYVTGAGRLEAKAKKVKKYINSRGSTKKETEIENKSYAEAFAAATGKNCVLGTQLTQTLEDLDITQKISQRIQAAIDAPNLDDTKLKAVFDSQGWTTLSDAHSHAQGAAIGSGVLVGNVRYVILIRDTEKSFSIEVEEKRETRAKTEDSINVEDKNNLLSHCDKIAAIARSVADLSKKDKSEDKILKAIDRHIKNAETEAKKENATDAAKTARTDARVARELIRAKGKISVGIKKVALHGCNKALGYISKCGSMYEK